MIAKIKVKKELALYELKIKDEIKKIENEIKKMDEIFDTNATRRIWRESAKYSALHTRLSTLIEALWLFQDIRCGEMLND